MWIAIYQNINTLVTGGEGMEEMERGKMRGKGYEQNTRICIQVK